MALMHQKNLLNWQLIIQDFLLNVLGYKNSLKIIYMMGWCCASLLHIPKQNASVYNRLWRSLKNKGICFVSYKSEIINKNDKRLFTCYDQKSLKKFINNSTNFLIKKIWTSKSEDNWINALLLK